MTVDTKAIEKVITSAARPETVFRLLTDPHEWVRWKGKIAQLEPRPGGVVIASGPPRRRESPGGHWREIDGPLGRRQFWIAQQT